MSRIEGYNSYSQVASMYDATKAKKTKEEVEVKTNSASQTKSVELSEKAQKLLEELKTKYSNADFMVADYSSEEEASSILSRGTKEYSVLIDPETLEAMANDEDTKNMYLNQLEDATKSLADIRDQLNASEDGSEIVSIGISISGDGTMLFFAELEHSSELQKERIEAAREASKEADAEAAKKAKEKEEAEELKKRLENYKRTSVKAGSVDELVEKIKNIDWSQIPVSEKAIEGGKIDFSV